MDDWVEIEGFEGYSVDPSGKIRNDRYGNVVTPVQNQVGNVYVGLYKDGVQRKRSTALIVAKTFLPKPDRADFTTPIHLDGDQRNNSVDNLAWRPRWFAVEYQHQFENPPKLLRLHRQIVDVDTRKIYDHSYHAAISNGLLERMVVMGVIQHTSVFPTNQIFEPFRN